MVKFSRTCSGDRVLITSLFPASNRHLQLAYIIAKIFKIVSDAPFPSVTTGTSKIILREVVCSICTQIPNTNLFPQNIKNLTFHEENPHPRSQSQKYK